jgi:predicted esterase
MVGHFVSRDPAAGSARMMMLATAMLLVTPHLGTGQSPAGQLEERIASSSDTSQKYALYLPPGYTPQRQWPVLFVLDPRSRAVSALELFQDAAAELGWVVMSSYNSRSDSLPALNDDAMEAMLSSAQERLSIDRSRLYLAGFSGTARAVLQFSVPLRGHIAGVIAVGGALGAERGGPETIFAGDSSFAYFGAAGTRDFNYQEVLAMADRFTTANIPSRVAVFDGPHSWPPAEICRQAMEWFELRAMRAGRRPLDSAWVRIRLQAEFARAAEMERSGQWDEALRLYESVTRDYLPSGERNRAAERMAVLRNDRAVKRHRARVRKLAEEDMEQARDLQKTLEWAEALPGPPTAENLVRRLKIEKLKERAEQGDSLEAPSAERRLALIFALLAFYEPRTYLAEHSADRALAMLEAATRIGPLEGESCAMLKAALRAIPTQERAGLKGQCAAAKGS